MVGQLRSQGSGEKTPQAKADRGETLEKEKESGEKMKVVTAGEMKEIDRRAVEEYGIPALVLMENAGLNVVMAMEKEFKSLQGKKVFIFAGKGNKGGDGLVVARHLANMGAQVKVYLLAKAKDVSHEAKT